MLVGCQDGFDTSGSGESHLDEVRRLTGMDSASDNAVTLPVRWTLTDVEGRSLEANVIGRSANSVTLVRVSDGKRFDLPVARLSEGDRKRVARLPLVAAPQSSPQESSIYRMRQAALGEAEARIVELRQMLNTTDSQIKKRSYTSEIKRLETERGDLLEEIREIESHRSVARPPR